MEPGPGEEDRKSNNTLVQLQSQDSDQSRALPSLI